MRGAGRREGRGAAGAAQEMRAGGAPTAEVAVAGGRREAHQKHGRHGFDAGRVPAQRLVERPRELPSKKAKHVGRGAACGAGRREGCGAAAAAQAACAGRTPNCGGCAGRGRCGAHIKHLLHVRDAGRVPAQRLVERLRGLPRRKGTMCGKRGGMRGRATVGARGPAAAQAACAGSIPTAEVVLAGARAGRT